MRRADLIHARLHERFSPVHLVIHDDSAHHAGHAGAPAGGESHFRIEIVAQVFCGRSRLAAHRLIHETLLDLFEDGLHALAISASCPEVTS